MPTKTKKKSTKAYNTLPYSRAVPYTSPTGISTTLYSIGVLAERLGRSTQTVRKWEIGGIIPPTPFKIRGDRFYAEEYIDVIVKSAEKSKIKTGKPIGSTQFSNRCYREFKRLNEEFFGTK